MLLLLGEFTILTIVIVIAGGVLTRYADAIGQLTGLGRSMAGIMLLATATSLPELSVDCSAAFLGAADLAVGCLMGSSLLNLLILAVLDLISRPTGRMLSRMAAAHAISATMSIVLTSLALLFLLVNSGWSILGWVGPGTIAIAVSYLLLLRLVFFDQQFAAARLEESEEPGAAEELAGGSLPKAITGYLVATIVIFVSAPMLAGTADELAAVTGLGRTFIGTTLVALATSLPEVVTTLAALRMGAVDMAVGNIFGSNSFNMMTLLPVDLCQPGSLLAAVSPTHAVTAASVILITAVITVGLLYRVEKRFWIIEPDAILVILLVIAALATVYYLR